MHNQTNLLPGDPKRPTAGCEVGAPKRLLPVAGCAGAPKSPVEAGAGAGAPKSPPGLAGVGVEPNNPPDGAKYCQ